MPRLLLIASSRSVLLAFEVIGILLLVLLVAAGLMLWRLSSGPLDVSFARDYISQTLRDPSTGHSVAMDKVLIEWPDLKKPLMLDLGNLRVMREGQTAISVARVRLGLHGPSLLTGDIEPVSVILNEPVLRIVRTTDDRVVLDLEDAGPADITAEGNPATESTFMRMIETLARPPEKFDKRSPLSHLQGIEIADARAIVEDHVLGVTWNLQKIDFLFARTDRGLGVTAAVQIPGGRNGASLIQGDVLYDRDTRLFTAAVNLQDFDPRSLSRKVPALAPFDTHEIYLNGTVRFTIDTKLTLSTASVSLAATEGWLGLPTLYDAPFPYQELALDASYDRAGNSIDIKNMSLRVNDILVTASSRIALGKDKIESPVSIVIPELPQAKIAPLWPPALDDLSVKEWLTQRLSDGIIRNTNIKFNLTAARNNGEWTTDAGEITAAFDLDGMTVDYSPPLTPAKNTSGHGKIENDVLDISIASADVADMKLSDGRVLIDNLTSNQVGTATITTGLKGPLPSVLRYIASEPIGVDGDQLGLSIDAVKGQADLKVSVSFPTLKDLPAEKVKVDVQGKLADVFLPDVVEDMDLTGGPLDIAVDAKSVKLKGTGKIDTHPVTFDWQQYLDSAGAPFNSRVRAQLDADLALRTKLGIDLKDWMEGTVPADVTYTEYADGRAEASITADATPARLMVEPFAYEKTPGTKSDVKARALFVKGKIQEINGLDIKTPDLNVENARLLFETVKDEVIVRRGQFPKFILKETDTGLDFEIAADGLMKVRMKGSFLDARPFLDDKNKDKTKSYDGPPLMASVEVGRMRTDDTSLVEKAKIYVDIDRQGMLNQLELDAVAGAGDIYFRLKPDVTGRMGLRIEADDAGAALRAFNIYPNVQGGTIIMAGEAPDIRNKHRIQGTAQLNNFRVINAPVLAQLVGALGLTGLPQLLSGEGLSFTRLESNFMWDLRRPGDLYTITDGRTSGSSLGLTFEGRIDKAQGVIDMNGEIVPVSEINTLIGNIPIIGAILGGGDSGAVFAATYNVNGPDDKPVVTVNPLAVLAPGILRRIFFEGGD